LGEKGFKTEHVRLNNNYWTRFLAKIPWRRKQDKFHVAGSRRRADLTTIHVSHLTLQHRSCLAHKWAMHCVGLSR